MKTFIQKYYSSMVTFFIIYLFIFFNQLGNLFKSWSVYFLFTFILSITIVCCLILIGKMSYLKKKSNRLLVSSIQFLLFFGLFVTIAVISVLDNNYNINYVSAIFTFQVFLSLILGGVFSFSIYSNGE